jgi:hypothetical protein
VTEEDPWTKAAECERAIQATDDAEQRLVLTNLRNLWIAIGNQRAMLGTSALAQEIAKLAQLHADLLPAQETRH